jgi:hypothetical protein
MVFIRESAGKPSKAAVLILAPRFTGQSQGRSTLSRRATYRSLSPKASGGTPGRFETKYKVRPSWEMAGAASPDDVLMADPRLTGADHSDHFDCREALVDGISIMTIATAPHAAMGCRLI